MPTEDFKGYLFWYFTLQCVLATAAFAGFFGYGFIVTFLQLADPDTVTRQADAIEKPFTALGAIACIFLAITVASRHGIKFGKGFGGYLLGNVAATIAMLPLSEVPSAIAQPLTAFWVQLLLILVYAAVLAVMIICKRRQAIILRRQQALVEPFA